MSSDEYAVVVADFAQRHYIKSFEKKYKKAWAVTLAAIVAELQRVEALLGVNSYIETICHHGDIKILKIEFRVAGTQESRHGSGNRCIVALHADLSKVCILLVYAKTDVIGSRETDWWKGLVRDNFSQYKSFF